MPPEHDAATRRIEDHSADWEDFCDHLGDGQPQGLPAEAIEAAVSDFYERIDESVANRLDRKVDA